MENPGNIEPLDHSPSVRPWRKRVEALIGKATPGGSPDSRMNHGHLARLLAAQGFNNYLPEPIGGVHMTAARIQTAMLEEIRKKSTRQKRASSRVVPHTDVLVRTGLAD